MWLKPQRPKVRVQAGLHDGSFKGRFVRAALAVPGPEFPICRTLPTICAANEGPVSIQYKCLVPIYVFPEMKLFVPKQNYNVLSPSFLHSYICESFIYSQDRSAYSPAGKYVGRSWEYINRSQTQKKNVGIGTERPRNSYKRNT
jgi:hypothetical protein